MKSWRDLFLIFLVLLALIIPVRFSVSTVSADEIDVDLVGTESAELQDVEILPLGNKINKYINLDKEYWDLDITNEYYIPNWNYFYLNPYHEENTRAQHPENIGVCTTVAMQMLMGYYNYYTDRRLIPNDGNGFLSSNYGDLENHPHFYDHPGQKYGLKSIGTTENFFNKLYELSGKSQVIGSVVDAANKFVGNYSARNIDPVSIILEQANALNDNTNLINKACNELTNGRPVLLVFSMLRGADSFHVVPAYGSAVVGGDFGFIVHCGWEDDNKYVWVPSKWVEYLVTMNVGHDEHSFVDSGENILDAYRELICDECGCTTVMDLYEVEGNKITSLNYPIVEDEVTIPSKIKKIFDIHKYNNNEIEIRAIGDSVFANTEIFSVTLPKTITSIGSFAFENCHFLHKVELREKLATIESYAFANCNNLYEFEFPLSINYIGIGAFSGCSNMQDITFNSSSTMDIIAKHAFSGCAINEIKLPYVAKIGEEVFKDCKDLMEVTLSYVRSESYIASDAFKTNGLRLINLKISSGEIPPYLFMFNNDIRKLTIGKWVTNIGSYAFANCEYLHEVEFEPNYELKALPDNAFTGSSLVSINIPASVESIGESAFENCVSLKSIEFPNNSNLSSIGEYAFGFSGLKTISMPASVESIGSFVFWGCDNLVNVEFAANSKLTSIGEYAFLGCYNLRSVEFSANSKLKNIGDYVFSESGLKTINIPAGVKSIGNYAFANCTNLANVTFEVIYSNYEPINYLNSIGEYAFSNTAITRIVLNENVRYIGEYAFKGSRLQNVAYKAKLGDFDTPSNIFNDIDSKNLHVSFTVDVPDFLFYGVTNLTSVTFNVGTTTIGRNAFACCTGLTEIDTSFVHTIYNRAFIYCSGLKNITIGMSLSSLGAYAFLGCYNNTGFKVDIANMYFRSSGNNLVQESDNVLVAGCANGTIMDGISGIAPYAFFIMEGLKSITIPCSVKSIGKYAFYGCKDLATVNIESPASYGVITMGDGAFSQCPKLTDIYVLDDDTKEVYSNILPGRAYAIKSIYTRGLSYRLLNDGTYAVKQGERTIQGELIIPATYNGIPVTQITYEGFISCDNITSAYLPWTINFIGSAAFGHTTSLEKIKVDPNNETYMSVYNSIIRKEDYALIVGCKTSFLFSGVLSIDDFAFYGCSGLTDLFIPNSVKSIGFNAFYDCVGLTSLDTNLVESIGINAFMNCSGIKSVTIGPALNRLGIGAFAGCYKNAGFKVNANNKYFRNSGNNLVKSSGNVLVAGVSSVYCWIFDDIYEIASEAFWGMKGLSDLFISYSVKSIGSNAFTNCPNLFEVRIKSPVSYAAINIASNAFSKCARLKYIYVLDDDTKEAYSNILPDYANAIISIYTRGLSYRLLDDGTYAVKHGEDKEIYDLIIPASYNGILVTQVLSIGFMSCTNLASVDIPWSINFIGDCAFGNIPNLAFIEVDPANPTYMSVDNCIIRMEDDVLVLGGTMSIIPEYVKVIGANAFRGREWLMEITIPRSVVRIERTAFYGCIRLEEIWLYKHVSVNYNSFSDTIIHYYDD